MRRSCCFARGICPALFLIISACSGGASGVTTSAGGFVPQSAARDLQIETPPTPIPVNAPWSYIASLKNIGPGLHAVRFSALSFHSAAFYSKTLAIRRPGERTDSQYVGNVDIQAGFDIPGPYDDLSANLSAWTNLSVQLPSPPSGCQNGWGCDNNIGVNLHPGTNGNTGNCLESGDGFYTNVGSGPPAVPVFWVGDFCNISGGNGIEAYPVQYLMDSAFTQNYVANLGDGVPRITIEVMQPTTDPNTNDWYVLLYNYYNKSWYQVYSTTGNFLFSYAGQNSSNPRLGWSLDEAHFNAINYTDCPTVPTFSETGIQGADESSGNDASNYWRPLGFSDYNLVNYGQSFYNDGSPTGAIYTFQPYNDQWNYPAWQVTDPHPMPTPIRTPDPCAKNPRLCLSPVKP